MQKLDKILLNVSLRKNFSMNSSRYRHKDHDISQFCRFPEFFHSARPIWNIFIDIPSMLIHLLQICTFFKKSMLRIKNCAWANSSLKGRTRARVKWCRFAKTWIPWQPWLVWIIWVKEEKIELFEILLSRKFLDA